MSKGTIRYPLFLFLALSSGLAACAPKGEELYARAEKSLDGGEVRAAIIDLKNLVKDAPENGKARALLAAALVQNGEMGAAAIEIKKAKDLGVSAEALLVPECRVMTARGEFDDVLARCMPESVADEYKPEMQIAQGRALLGLERAAEAKPQFEAALAAKPDSIDALLGLAAATYAVDGLPAAKAVVDKASEPIKQKSAYWMAVGGINMQGDDYAAGEQAYARAVGIAKKGGDANERMMSLGALAEAQMRQAKVKEATATTDQMMKVAPDNPMVKQLRGQVAAAGGNLEEARTLLEEAVASMPENYQARLLLGIVNAQQGNLGQAEMHFQNVVNNQPDNARAQRLLAEVRARSQTPEQTLAAIEPSLTGEEADPSLLAMAGRMSLASGDREQALEYLAQASAAPGKEQPADVQLEVASGYLAAGDLDRAVELLEKMPEGGATGLRREQLLMLALLQKGENDKAIAEARALVARSDDDAAVRNLAAGVYAAAGKRDLARQEFNAALKIKPNDAATLTNLARLDLAEGKPADAEANFKRVLDADPKNLLAMTGVAVSASARGDNKEAEKWLNKAAADHPDSVEARLSMAQFYLGTRDFGKALAVLDEAAKMAPDNAAVSNARGLALLGNNDVPGALASFKKATTQAPKAYGYAFNLARGHLVNRDLDSALGVLNDVLKAEPKFVPALSLAAASSLQAGKLESATGYVERLRQAAPDAQGTFAIEGDLAMAQKRYRDALGHYRKASAKGETSALVMAQYRAATLSGAAAPEKVVEDWVAKHPEDANAIAVLAETRQRKGDADGAIALYEQSLEKTPDNAVLLNNLAVLYQAKGDPKAVQFAERAYEAAPKSPAIQDTYGWILFKDGQNDKAFDLLRDANKGLPDNAEVQYHYAAALAKKGEKTEAIALLKKAVNGQLPADQKADAQKLLGQLSK
jgi:putative PEP-CTERM system TPR-repeat lipoprotein